jgi:hypothetical protein
MKIGYNVHVNKRCFQRLHGLALETSLRSVKEQGTIFVRAAAAMTPPHQARHASSASLNTQKNADIQKSRELVRRNILGAAEPQKVRAVPYRNLPGAWLALDPATNKPARIKSVFGIVVPESVQKVRGQKVPLSNLPQVYAGARWNGKRMVPARRKTHFVNAGQLDTFIKQKQGHVGKLISGWAPAARVFATGKKIAAGFFEKLGGKGFGRIIEGKDGLCKGFMVNRQPYQPAQADLIQRNMQKLYAFTKAARAVQKKKILAWYKKQAKAIFGVN